jgi:hypothetical protein
VYVDRRPPAAHDNSAKLLGLGTATALVVLMMGVMFWVLAANDNRSSLEQLAQDDDSQAAAAPAAPAEPAPAPEPAPDPAPEPVVVPAAPAQSELASNNWLLAQYALIKEGGNLTVTGTVRNLADIQRSATLRVFVYADGAHVATGTGEVRGVAGGANAEVSLPSGTPWSAGDVILLQAEDL